MTKDNNIPWKKPEDKFTSLNLSKKLKEGGCELESDYLVWGDSSGNMTISKVDEQLFHQKELYPAYDIIWDVCVKYAKEFFGEEPPPEMPHSPRYMHEAKIILFMMQNKEDREYIEKYIWENCLFNKDNK